MNRFEVLEPSGNTVGLDVGLKEYYTDSDGVMIENPKFLRKGEIVLKRSQRRVSRKVKGSINRRKARLILGIAVLMLVKCIRVGAIRQFALRSVLHQIDNCYKRHLKISRQRKDHAIKLARCVITSNDVVAYEDLRIKNMVKNHCLARSINDRVSASQTLLTQQFWGSSKTRRSSKVLHWGDEWD